MMNPSDRDMERENTPTELPGLTATMEIAGAESIPGAHPENVTLGYSRED